MVALLYGTPLDMHLGRVWYLSETIDCAGEFPERICNTLCSVPKICQSSGSNHLPAHQHLLTCSEENEHPDNVAVGRRFQS